MINTFKANPKESSAHFNLKNMVIPDVKGHFSSVSGTFSYDPEKIENGLIEACIDVKTVDTGSELTNEKLKSAEFFDVKKYPLIKFLSNKIEIYDEEMLKVTGNLTVKDVTKEVILNVEKPDELGSKKLNVVASTLINREEFNLDLGNVLEVTEMLMGDNIQIIMDIELIKQN